MTAFIWMVGVYMSGVAYLCWLQMTEDRLVLRPVRAGTDIKERRQTS